MAIKPEQEQEVRRILKRGNRGYRVVSDSLNDIAKIFGMDFDSQGNAVDLTKMGSNPVRDSAERLNDAVRNPSHGRARSA